MVEIIYGLSPFEGTWVVEVLRFVMLTPAPNVLHEEHPSEEGFALAAHSPPPLQIAECNIFKRHGKVGRPMFKVIEGDIQDVKILIDVEKLGTKLISCGRKKHATGSFWLALPYRTMFRLQ